MATDEQESLFIANKVRELMERHGIAERQQASELRKILGLGVSASHRKINGETPWSLGQIRQVAAHFNEAPSKLIDGMSAAPSTTSLTPVHEATLIIETKEISCTIQIAGLVGDGQPTKFIAFDDDGRWSVLAKEEAYSGPKYYQVEKIEINLSEAKNNTIAVIDDDIPTANNIRDYLNEVGFKATAYYSLQSATAALQRNLFDGYVLDWFFGNETSEDILKLIRASENPGAPTILLTGWMETGKVSETEVATLMRRFDVFPQEKPARLAIIGVELSKMLGVKEA